MATNLCGPQKAYKQNSKTTKVNAEEEEDEKSILAEK